MKPVIGVTTFLNNQIKKSIISVNFNYANSILLAGGIPVLIPLITDKEKLSDYLKILDGIVFTGGEDVSPLKYGENPLNKIKMTADERDECEFTLFNGAYEMGIPVLGICRGAQLINVSLKGSLYQDINDQVEGSLGHSPFDNYADQLYHSVNILKDSKLYDIFKKDNIFVNSFHHQAVNKLGENLRISAISTDGIIEAFESTDDKFIMGIQWHPEGLTIKYPEFVGIFEALVKTCENRK